MNTKKPASRPNRPRRKPPSILAHTALLIVIVAAGFFAAITPRLADFAPGAALDPGARLTQAAALRSELDNLRALSAAVDTVPDRDRERLAAALPENPSYPELIVLLRSLADHAGMDLLSVALQPAPARGRTSGNPAAMLRVQLGADGYPQLKTFLRGAERSLRLMDLEQLSFKPDNGGVSVQFKAYYVPAP